MNYYDARELKSGGFHYTCRNDDRIWGVGYDGKFQTCPDCGGQSAHLTDASCGRCSQKGYIEVTPHPPHATKDEAYACATQFVLDTARFDQNVDTSHSVPRCEYPDCSVLVEDGGAVSYGFGISGLKVLCPDHRNRESLAEIIGSMGVTISS